MWGLARGPHPYRRHFPLPDNREEPSGVQIQHWQVSSYILTGLCFPGVGLSVVDLPPPCREKLHKIQEEAVGWKENLDEALHVHSRIRTAWWKLTMSQTMTYIGCPAWFSCSQTVIISCRPLRNARRWFVLYGSRFVWWWRTPQFPTAAQRVTFPPRWPGTSTMARLPITVFHDCFDLLKGTWINSVFFSLW